MMLRKLRVVIVSVSRLVVGKLVDGASNALKGFNFKIDQLKARTSTMPDGYRLQVPYTCRFSSAKTSTIEQNFKFGRSWSTNLKLCCNPSTQKGINPLVFDHRGREW